MHAVGVCIQPLDRRIQCAQRIPSIAWIAQRTLHCIYGNANATSALHVSNSRIYSLRVAAHIEISILYAVDGCGELKSFVAPHIASHYRHLLDRHQIEL